MNDTGFVAPDKQLGHGLQVRPAGDVCPHGGLITPEAGGPECAFTVSKQKAIDKSIRPLYLPPGPHRMNEKLRHKSKRADA